MILAVDIGNTSISLGLFVQGKLHFRGKLTADRSKSADEYAVLIRELFSLNCADLGNVEGAILLSVVPTLTHTLREALSFFGISPIVVGAGLRTGLNIRVESPGQLGTDLVANTVAALRIADPPLIVIDLGTATTLTAINEKRELCGCIIAPGVRLSIDALAARCAQLPDISLVPPTQFLGKNTDDCMNSGAIWGSALMLDGMINKIRCDYAFGEQLTVIATGGLAGLIIPLCKNKILYAPNLTLEGLYQLYQSNAPRTRQTQH